MKPGKLVGMAAAATWLGAILLAPSALASSDCDPEDVNFGGIEEVGVDLRNYWTEVTHDPHRGVIASNDYEATALLEYAGENSATGEYKFKVWGVLGEICRWLGQGGGPDDSPP